MNTKLKTLLLTAGIALAAINPASAGMRELDKMSTSPEHLTQFIPKPFLQQSYLQLVALGVQVNTFDGACTEYYGPLALHYKTLVGAINQISSKYDWQITQIVVLRNIKALQIGNDYKTAVKNWCGDASKFIIEVGQYLDQNDEANRNKVAPSPPVETDYDRCLKQATTGQQIDRCDKGD